MIPAPVAAELALEKKTVMRKQKEMLVMANISMKKKNSVPSDFSKTASGDPPYQRACSIKRYCKHSANRMSADDYLEQSRNQYDGDEDEGQ